MSTNVEFAIQADNTYLSNVLEKFLSTIEGIDRVKVYPQSGTVVIKSSLPISEIQQKIESTGHKAVIKGYGGLENESLQAAVAIIGGESGLRSGKLKGVIRFIQADEKQCIIDGTIDGLAPGLHGLHVHELGDLSDGCNKVGNHFSLTDAPHGAPDNDTRHRHTGDLGNIAAGSDGRAQFRFSDSVIKVWDVIGRTVVVTEKEDDLGTSKNEQSKVDGNSGLRLGCGIIARTAGLFENNKNICACDGVSLWNERDKPLAGPDRGTQ